MGQSTEHQGVLHGKTLERKSNGFQGFGNAALYQGTPLSQAIKE
jgi:hypothetical protein